MRIARVRGNESSQRGAGIRFIQLAKNSKLPYRQPEHPHSRLCLVLTKPKKASGRPCYRRRPSSSGQKTGAEWPGLPFRERNKNGSVCLVRERNQNGSARLIRKRNQNGSTRQVREQNQNGVCPSERNQNGSARKVRERN